MSSCVCNNSLGDANTSSPWATVYVEKFQDIKKILTKFHVIHIIRSMFSNQMR